MEDLNDSSLLKTPSDKGKRQFKPKSKTKLGVTPIRKRKKVHSFSGKHNSSFNTSRIVIENLNTNNRALKFEHQKVLNEIKLRTFKCNQVKEENENLLLELPTLENVLNLTASEEKKNAVIDRKVEVYMQRLINLIGKSMKDVHQVLQSSTCIIQMLQVSNKIMDLPIIGDKEGEEFSFEERLGSILADIKAGNDGIHIARKKEETLRHKNKLGNISHPVNVVLPQRVLNTECLYDETDDGEPDIMSTVLKEDGEVNTNTLHEEIVLSPTAHGKVAITESMEKINVNGTMSPLNSKTRGNDSVCLQGNEAEERQHDTIDYSDTDMEMTEVIDASISFMVPPNIGNTHSNLKEQLSTTILDSHKVTEPAISEEQGEKLEINVDIENSTDISCVLESNKSSSPMPHISMEKSVTPKMCGKKPFTEIDENTTEYLGKGTDSDIKLVSETESSSEETPQKSKTRSKRLNGSSRSKKRQSVDYVDEDEEIFIIPDSCKKKKSLRDSPFFSQQQDMSEDTNNENMIKRPKRSKEPISYKERPINIKMRKE